MGPVTIRVNVQPSTHGQFSCEPISIIIPFGVFFFFFHFCGPPSQLLAVFFVTRLILITFAYHSPSRSGMPVYFTRGNWHQAQFSLLQYSIPWPALGSAAWIQYRDSLIVPWIRFVVKFQPELTYTWIDQRRPAGLLELYIPRAVSLKFGIAFYFTTSCISRFFHGEKVQPRVMGRGCVLFIINCITWGREGPRMP
jgi:hypothetical protein